MKVYIKLCFYILFCLSPAFIGACSSQPVSVLPKDADVLWSAEKDAIVLKFSATRDLNLDQGRPSSLSICVYQLSEARLFEQIREEGPKGLAALAACQRFGDSALSAARYFLEPGQTLEPQFVERREGAKFVGLAAAYYNLESERCARLFPIPIIQISDSWFGEPRREPGQLLVELVFGANWPEPPAHLREK